MQQERKKHQFESYIFFYGYSLPLDTFWLFQGREIKTVLFAFICSILLPNFVCFTFDKNMTVIIFTILPAFSYFAWKDVKKFDLKTMKAFTSSVPEEW